MHFLPREAALTGFEAGIPHLRRHDGKAVMFPHLSGAARQGRLLHPRVQFAYADEDVFFLLDGEVLVATGAPGNWAFELDDLDDLGVRHHPEATGLPDGLVCSRTIYDFRGAHLQPLPRLAQRLTAALIDGWLVWGGSPLRLLDDPKHLTWLASQGSPEPMPPHDKSGIDLAAKSNRRGQIRLSRRPVRWPQHDRLSAAGRLERGRLPASLAEVQQLRRPSLV